MNSGAPWSVEPSLDEIMADPMTRLIMRRDRVAEIELRGLLDRLRATRRRLAAARGRAA